MVCKNCNTRLSGSEKHCPNCGRAVRDPGLSGSQTSPPETPALSGSRASAAVDLELNDEVAELDAELPPLDEPKAFTPRPGSSGSRHPAAKPAATPKPTPATKPAPAAPRPVALSLDPEELRARLAEQPELLEAGLQVFRDAKNRTVGAGYDTEVGCIDLLARDAGDQLVVVVVADATLQGDPVAAALERIGWVTKHLAGEQGVRGILLFEPPAPELGYAARAVAGSLVFKTFRVALRFDDLEV